MIVVKQFRFAAAHRLPNHHGACRNLHGHTWKLEVGVTGEINDVTGMIADFGEIKSIVNQVIIDKLDHQYLNELAIPDFPSDCPTAENMVNWMGSVLRRALRPIGGRLAFVRLWESDTSYAERNRWPE